MVHDHTDLAAAGRLIHIPVPVGKGSTVEAAGEGSRKTLKPLLSSQVPRSQELKREWGIEVRPIRRTMLSNMDITINHLTFATASLQGGIYYHMMSAKLLWEKAASRASLDNFIIFFCFWLTGFCFSFLRNQTHWERHGLLLPELALLPSPHAFQ